MDIFSAQYLILFLPFKVLIFYLLPQSARKYWLAVISLLFLTSFGLTSLVTALCVSVITYYFSLRISVASTQSKKMWGLVGIALIVCLLFLNRLPFKVLSAWEPIGIGLSYYGLMCIAYLADVSAKRLKALPDYLSITLYTIYFPQLTAGPISQPVHLVPQLESFTLPSQYQISTALKRIVYGLFCKLVIGDGLNLVSVPILDLAVNASSWQYLLASFGYTMQIYFEFAGYSFLVMGISRLFGIEIVNNFNRPYLATSTRDFWKRWHISLTRWLRRYIYFPLGGSKNRALFPLAVLIVFIISGLWHGFEQKYFIWGMMHAFAYLIGYYLSLFKWYRPFYSNQAFILFKWLAFIIWIDLTWLVFRSDEPIELFRYLIDLDFKWQFLELAKHTSLMYWITIGLIFLVIDHIGVPELVIRSRPKDVTQKLREIVFIDFWLISLFFLGGIGSKQVLYFNF